VSLLPIRTYPDPVLSTPTTEVEEIDAALGALCDSMLETMYAAPGVGLAANQIGVSKRFFVYDAGQGPRVVINPRIVETSGEWTYDEGCLSVPEMGWEITRPATARLVGLDLEGRPLDIVATELEARIFQHETDHLDGHLLLERITDDERKDALRELRRRRLPGRAG
jgi:peptide deformylase